MIIRIFILAIFICFQVQAQQHELSCALMPMPQTVTSEPGKLKILEDFSISVPEGASKKVFDCANRFLRRLDGRTGVFFIQGVISEIHPQRPAFPTLQVNVTRKANLDFQENEAYSISIKPDKILLEAETDLGIIHGFETLLQLLSNDESGYYFPIVEIKDTPRFAWRGLMIDVASHFMPVNIIKRNIDAMAMVKMNVLHLSLCNDNGWRVESKLFPKLHLLASEDQYFSQAQIKEIVQYASDRGIRVVPEINLPSKSTAIQVAYPEFGLTASQANGLSRIAGNHHTMLNVGNEKTFEFLEKLLPEISALFPDKYFHIGGDNIDFKLIVNDGKNSDFLKKNSVFSAEGLQVYFINRINKSFKKTNKKLIAWDNMFHENLDKQTIFQVKTKKETTYDMAISGYQNLLSFGYELDLMLPTQTHYTNDPLPLLEIHTDKDKKKLVTPAQEKNIIGGEALMWTDFVSANSFDSRVWPRTAAIAERLWSVGTVVDISDMYKRQEKVNIQLQECGLNHISNQNAVLQQLSGQHDITPLKVLIGTLEPYKNSLQLQRGSLYKTYSPLSLFTDAAIVDAYDARKFRTHIISYLHTRSTPDKIEIDKYLRLWRDNHNEIIRIASSVPTLRNLLKTSENLNTLAIVGLDALKHTETKINAPKAWYDAHLLTINTIKKYQIANMSNALSQNDARCELVIIDDIITLLDLANQDLAKKRIYDEEHSKK